MTAVIRAARAAEALAVAQVHVRSWQAGYRDLLPATYLAALDPVERAARYTFDRATGPRTSVAERDGVIAGFVTIAGAELAALHVDPAWWRHGIGRALIAHARGELAASGVAEAFVWLLAGNVRGQRFYEADGWLATGETRTATVWGVAVDELRFTRPIAPR